MRNYPVAYTEHIKASASEFDLDPYLVQSIMRCESSNDPLAVSDAGAIGLMQIMPDTGTWIAHKLDLDSVYTEDMLYDPEVKHSLCVLVPQFPFGQVQRRRHGDDSGLQRRSRQR